MTTAVVLVSGGAAVTPYTTPDGAARSGLAAGNTMTAIRSHLLEEGHWVFTAPASIGGAPADADTGWQGFADVAQVLPAALTMNAVGTIDDAGERLHAFLEWLVETHSLTAIALVGHSMGGLFSRSALRWERRKAVLPAIDRLVTLGTPWTGSLLGDHRSGTVTLDDAHGDRSTEQILERSLAYADANSQGAADEASESFLAGETGWNARQRGVLEGVAVTLLAGDHFDAHASPEALWPHDGLVSLRSARADAVDADVLPHRTAATFPDVHSIFFADAFELPWERSLTWDPAVLARIEDALG